MPTTEFTANRHGSHFANTFVNPVVNIPGLGDINTYGLCGGMTFASLDYFYAGGPGPTHNASDFGAGTTNPPPGSRLYQYIYGRQLNSFDPRVNPSVVKFLTQSWPIGRSAYEVTVEDEWPLIMNEIDAGRPAPIGLISSGSVVESHQVVAIGYSTNPSRRIQIYDCNYPDTAVELVLDDGARAVIESTGDRWVGLFLEQYGGAVPSYFDLGMSAGISTNPGAPVPLNGGVEVGFQVRNIGDYPAHLGSLDILTRGPASEDLDGLFGPDGTTTTLSPGGEQTYLATTDSFGTSAGTYEMVAYYLSLQGEWFVVPDGNAGSRSQTTVDAV
jgi:hypothetical protein